MPAVSHSTGRDLAAPVQTSVKMQSAPTWT
jgi:hypothetical protein